MMGGHAFDEAYVQYQSERSALRRFVRRAFLRSARSKLHGRTIDLGCGIGELLVTLPDGSIGLEYNPAAVRHCQARGLGVHEYDGEADGWSLSMIEPGRYQSLVISHVLEHLQHPADVLASLLAAASKLGIGTVLVIVPGIRGFEADATHLVMVDKGLLLDRSMLCGSGFGVTYCRYFPFDNESLGKYFRYQELQVVYSAEKA